MNPRSHLLEYTSDLFAISLQVNTFSSVSMGMSNTTVAPISETFIESMVVLSLNPQDSNQLQI